MMGEIERIEQVSLVDQAASRIRTLMLTGQIAPGTKVREEWLQGLLGISRPPIREAIQILVHEGLLERLARRGVRAREFTPRDAWEIYSLRAALDRYALTNGMPADEDLLEPMRTAIVAMRRASEESDHPGFVAANREFHLALVALARNTRLYSTYLSLMNQMQMFMSINLAREAEQDTEVGVRRHEALLKAIESGDLEQALVALDQHGESRFLETEPPE
jgi:DNA-binding GntR family transcriptional regulator